MTYDKPLPEPTPESMPFWDGLREHKIIMPKCHQCSEYIFYPRAICPNCSSSEFSWVELSGDGIVYTFTVARTPTHPGFASEVPYVIALVELSEGVRLTTNIVGSEPEAVRIGMPVHAVFDDVTDNVTLLKFSAV